MEPAMQSRMIYSRLSRRCVLAGACVVVLLPFAAMLLTSLRPAAEVLEGNVLSWPKNVTLDHWANALHHVCLGSECTGVLPLLLNSLLIAIPAVLISLALGAAVGFVLLGTTRAHKVAHIALFITLFIPPQATLYPTIFALRQLGQFGTTAGIIIVHVMWGLPFVALLFRSYFLCIPAQLMNMAQIDGAGSFAVFSRILMPMSLPIVASAAVLQFTYIWNDYILGLTFADSAHQPATVALTALAHANLGGGDYSVSMAAAFITTLPTVCLYLICGRFVADGMTRILIKE
jgi:glucose/mannose transport system permease protein